MTVRGGRTPLASPGHDAGFAAEASPSVQAPGVDLRPAWMWRAFAAVALLVPVAALVLEHPRMTSADVGDALAKVNACLNSSSFLLLLFGYVQIKRKNVALHRASMRLAFGASTLFLIGYVTRFALTGAHHFPEVGWLKTVYLVLLFSHMILAVVVLPLVLRTLYLATRGRFAEHRKIARITYPIWVYVSFTGVVVYVMLYHVAPGLR